MGGAEHEPRLRCRCADAEDISVLAAFLQDALLPLIDMRWLPEERRFLLVANRFCWEMTRLPRADGGRPLFCRTLCAVTVEEVTRVKTRGIDQNDRGQIFDLLTLGCDFRPEGGYSLALIFAAAKTIRLDVASIRVTAEDYGDPWPTPSLPHHPEI